MNRYQPGPWQASVRGGTSPEPLWVRLVPPALALVTAAVLLTDLAALLSSLLSGHGIPQLRGGLVGGPLQILAHANDPGLGWRNPGSAPPAWLLILILVLLAGGAGLLALYLWHRVTVRREARASETWRRKRHGYLSPEQANAAFGERAARRDAARLHPSLTAQELRQRPIAQLAIPLGRSGPHPIYASHEKAVGLLGGTRQGKTSMLARIALGHHGPLVYCSTKPFDLRFFFAPPPGLPSSPGRSLLFNPDALSGLPTARYDPTIGCTDPERAQLAAEAILARQRARARDRGLDWALLAEKLLKYLLHAAALQAADCSSAQAPGAAVGMRQVIHWVAAPTLEGAAEVLDASPRAPHWAQLLREMARSAPETFYSIKINLHEALVAWEDPGLLERMSDGGADAGGLLDPEALIRRGDRLSIVARPGGHSVPLVTALVSRVVEAARQMARRTVQRGGRLDPPLLLLLDEVAKVCPLPQLPELVTDCASQGIVLVYALQSLEDGEVAWGETRFRGMWSATNCHVVLGGVSSSPALHDLSDLSPTVRIEEPRDSVNHLGQRLDPVVRWERALTTDDISALEPLTGVAFYGKKPMRLSMPYVTSPESEVRLEAEAAVQAWERWAAAHQPHDDEEEDEP